MNPDTKADPLSQELSMRELSAAVASLAMRPTPGPPGLNRLQVTSLIKEQIGTPKSLGSDDFDLLIEHVDLASDVDWTTIDPPPSMTGAATRLGLKCYAECNDGSEIRVDVRKIGDQSRMLHYHGGFEAADGPCFSTGYGTCPVDAGQQFQYRITRTGTVTVRVYLDEAY